MTSPGPTSTASMCSSSSSPSATPAATSPSCPGPGGSPCPARGPAPLVWQVGFSDFDLRFDPHSEPSIRFLRSRGVNFDDLRADGVSARAFAATLVGSGVVSSLNRNWLTWVTFGGLYDFGFLLKMLTGGRPLPATREEFVAKLGEYLGARVYDAKYVASRLPTGLVLSGGLSFSQKLPFFNDLHSWVAFATENLPALGYSPLIANIVSALINTWLILVIWTYLVSSVLRKARTLLILLSMYTAICPILIISCDHMTNPRTDGLGVSSCITQTLEDAQDKLYHEEKTE